MKVGSRMPACVGRYESGNYQCDGNKKSKLENERKVCVYRDRCAALKMISEKAERPLENYIVLRNKDKRTYAFALFETLLPQVQQAILDYRISGGIVGAKRRDRPLAIVAPKPPKEDRAPNTKQMTAWLFRRLAVKVGTLIAESTPIEPGQMFLVDRSEKSSYKALYMKEAKSKRALASVYVKPHNDTVEVRLAEDYAKFVATLPDNELRLLRPEDYTGKDGAFNVRIKNVDKLRASMIADRFAPLIRARV